jgi:hypothetical protein
VAVEEIICEEESGLKWIDIDCFVGCKAQFVEIPASVESLGDSCFAGPDVDS